MSEKDDIKTIAKQLSVIQKQNISIQRILMSTAGLDAGVVDTRFIDYNGNIVSARFDDLEAEVE